MLGDMRHDLFHPGSWFTIEGAPSARFGAKSSHAAQARPAALVAPFGFSSLHGVSVDISPGRRRPARSALPKPRRSWRIFVARHEAP